MHLLHSLHCVQMGGCLTGRFCFELLENDSLGSLIVFAVIFLFLTCFTNIESVKFAGSFLEIFVLKHTIDI